MTPALIRDRLFVRLAAIAQQSWFVPLMAALLSAGFFAATLQIHINGGNHPYATDVGELQNALPRWGTIHFSGYPLYSITGSFIVTALCVVGVAPAAGASMVSMFWGAMTSFLLAYLLLEMGVWKPAAILGPALFSVSTSMWVYSSLAEVHSMTMFFIAGILFLAFRFGKYGLRRDLIWLTVFLSQGLFHGRSVAGVGLAAIALVYPRWRMIWRNLPRLIAISLLAPLLYAYMPLREWMGSDWTFGNTSTWQGFWSMFLNIKAARFIDVETPVFSWGERLSTLLDIVRADLPLIVVGAGLAGLFFARDSRLPRWRTILALMLAWIPFAAVAALIYAGFVGDALLAVKLPVSLLAGAGAALLISWLYRRRRWAGAAALAAGIVALAAAAWMNYPDVTAVTRDRSVEDAVAAVDRISNPAEPVIVMVPWGHDYWAMRYAQTYRGQLQGLTLVDHNGVSKEALDEGYRLVTLRRTFFVFPESWWESVLGPVYLDAYSPRLVEIRTEPRAADPDEPLFVVNEDLAIESYALRYQYDGGVVVIVRWRALRVPQRDYSVAAHLWAEAPVDAPPEVLAQADSNSPVGGWYPTSTWNEGQVVQDAYQLQPPDGRVPGVAAITAYYVDENGAFVNGNWLTIPYLGE